MSEPGEFSKYEQLQVEAISKAVVSEVKNGLVCVPECDKKMSRLKVGLGAIGLLASYAAGLQTLPLLTKIATKFIS